MNILSSMADNKFFFDSKGTGRGFTFRYVTEDGFAFSCWGVVKAVTLYKNANPAEEYRNFIAFHNNISFITPDGASGAIDRIIQAEKNGVKLSASYLDENYDVKGLGKAFFTFLRELKPQLGLNSTFGTGYRGWATKTLIADIKRRSGIDGTAYLRDTYLALEIVGA